MRVEVIIQDFDEVVTEREPTVLLAISKFNSRAKQLSTSVSMLTIFVVKY